MSCRMDWKKLFSYADLMIGIKLLLSYAGSLLIVFWKMMGVRALVWQACTVYEECVQTPFINVNIYKNSAL